jgi:hypothetical protein
LLPIPLDPPLFILICEGSEILEYNFTTLLLPEVLQVSKAVCKSVKYVGTPLSESVITSITP